MFKISEPRRVQLLAWAEGVMSRPPDVVIGDNQVHRWMLWPRNNWRNIYVHRFLANDADEALHDHAPDNLSIILQNGYDEYLHARPLATELVNGRERFVRQVKRRVPGQMIFRLAGTPHSVNLIDGKPSVSLFIQGPRRREWGFHCVKGWKLWSDYIDVRQGYGNRTGKGCG